MAKYLAKKNIRLKNNYTVKRIKIKNLLENNIPTLEEYDNIIKSRVQRIKDRRHNINREINKGQNIFYLNKKELINLKIDNDIEMLKEKEKRYNK